MHAVTDGIRTYIRVEVGSTCESVATLSMHKYIHTFTHAYAYIYTRTCAYIYTVTYARTNDNSAIYGC